jgi:anaerobic selenocysteine-containing dehydrogenase
LQRDDLFTVVLEHFQTDTADYADLLLPATTFLEHPDLYTSYGHYYLQWAEPVVAPRGECRPNSGVFAELARRLGLKDPTLQWSAAECAESMLQSDHPWLAGLSWERLRREKSLRLQLPQPFRPYSEGSHHPDGKIRFGPPPRQLEFEERPDEDFPFRLISPPGAFIVNTSMGNIPSLLRQAGGQPRVIMHPEDAGPLGIEDQSMIEIRSRYGRIERQVLVSRDAAPRTVVALGQWWPKLAPDRRSLNDLTSERLTDLGGGSTFGNPVVCCRPLAPQGRP